MRSVLVTRGAVLRDPPLAHASELGAAGAAGQYASTEAKRRDERRAEGIEDRRTVSDHRRACRMLSDRVCVGSRHSVSKAPAGSKASAVRAVQPLGDLRPPTTPASTTVTTYAAAMMPLMFLSCMVRGYRKAEPGTVLECTAAPRRLGASPIVLGGPHCVRRRGGETTRGPILVARGALPVTARTERPLGQRSVRGMTQRTRDERSVVDVQRCGCGGLHWEGNHVLIVRP